MSNPNKAKVWIAETRTKEADLRYELFGKALFWEVTNRARTTVIAQLRGAFNRARATVEARVLEELMEN